MESEHAFVYGRPFQLRSSIVIKGNEAMYTIIPQGFLAKVKVGGKNTDELILFHTLAELEEYLRNVS